MMSGQPRSQHHEQLASTLQRAIQAVIGRGLHDPRIRGLVSVTSVVVSEDHKDATVHVSVLPAEHAKLTMHGLEHAAPHIKSQVAGHVRLRRVPTLRFRLDETLKKQAAVFAAMRRDGEPQTQTGSRPEAQPEAGPEPEKDPSP